MVSNNKGALQISFGWLFAIIAGAFILFLAIYGVTKLTKSEGSIQTAETSKEIGVLLNPLETGFEEAVTTSISFPAETRIYNSCSKFGEFGSQRIRVDQKNFDKWTKTNLEVEFPNKYIFSKSPSEGRTFYLFSKSFEFPFKINDLVYLTSSKESYCFEGDIPEDIEDEISDLKQPNLLLGNCSEMSTSVCFGSSKNCDVNVEYISGYVEKDGEELYFEGDSLMYAAIFSDSEIYECQLKRNMKRLSVLLQIYIDKEVLRLNACESDLGSLLINLKNSAEGFESSEELHQLTLIAQELEKGNEAARDCRLW